MRGLQRNLVTWTVLSLVLTVASGALAAAPGSFTKPVQLGFRAGDDWEPAIAADRFGHVYAMWTHYGADPDCPSCPSPHSELQVSSDGGKTWSMPRAAWPLDQRQDDPQIVVDLADGRTLYAAFMLGNKASMYVSKSTDFGQNWNTVLVETLQRGTDKDILAVRGRDVYLAYNAVQKIYASVSHDGGATWTTNHVVSNTNSKLGWSLAGGGGVDSRGTVYFAWEGYTQNGGAKGPVNIFVSRSSDGGATWTVSRVDVSQAPRSCSGCGWAYWGPGTALAVDGGDNVYLLYNANKVDGDADRMYFSRSTDHGQSWSAPSDASLAPTGANNLFPAVTAGVSGDVRIAWTDDRNGFDDGSNSGRARWNVYYRSSANGGTTWSPEVQVSNYVAGYPYKSATPKDGFLMPYGDYFELDVDSSGGTQAIWGEGPSYAGPGNVWYARRAA
jgi:BNR/Asp-box repeat protein